MDRRLGGSALLFFVLAGFVSNIGGGTGRRVETLPQTRETSRAKPANAKATEGKPADAIDTDVRRCSVVEILLRHYGLSESEFEDGAKLENSCQVHAFKALPVDLPRWEGGRVLIATVPDPLQTANALEFDRDIAALQEAAITSGYDFESIVSPWDVPSLEEPKEAKSGHEAERYRRLLGDKPGAMLFHRRFALDLEPETSPEPSLANDLLLMILVPESPTYGLNMHAAHEALDAIEVLENDRFVTSATLPADIHWIGPNYSASAPGLRRLVMEQHRFNVFSGSITGSAAIETLKRIDCGYYVQHSHASDITDPDGGPLDCDNVGDTEVTAPGSDEDLLTTLRKSHVPGTKTDEPIVVLQEDESSYGGSDIVSHNKKEEPKKKTDDEKERKSTQIRTLHFPRGISHVRRIFGGQYTNYRPTSGEAQVAPDTKSLFDFSDSLQQPLDTAPEFSVQSPNSNEAELASLAFSVQHMHASTVVILATDPLDDLFLARYFRQKLPDTRIVLFSAERLLPALRRQYDLDGTITVTRFPLFEDSYLETPIFERHSLTFMNSYQEGVFVAALHQINAAAAFNAVTEKKAEPLPIWIGVASGGSYWPLHHEGQAAASPHPGTGARTQFTITDIPPEPLPDLWVICTSLVLLSAAAHFALFLMAQPLNKNLMKSAQPWRVALARHRFLTFYLNCKPEIDHPQEFKREFGRRYWMFIANGHVFLVLSYLLIPGMRMSGESSLSAFTANMGSAFFYIVALAVTLAACALCVWLLIDLAVLYSPFRQVESARIFISPVITVAWLIASFSVFLRRINNLNDGWTFALRCVHLGSGVCPVLPLLFASCGFIIAAIVNLNALAVARDRNPQMPQVGLEILTLTPCKEKLTSFIEGWGSLPAPYGMALSLSVLVWYLIAQPGRMFGSLDGRGMTFLFTSNVVFGLWTIAWLWVRFMRVWSLLRSMLEALEGSPLRFAFSRLPKIFSVAPIWSYAGLRRTLILPMRWFEYFRITSKQPSHLMHQVRQSALLTRIAQQLFYDQVLIDGDYILFSRDQNEYAATLVSSLPAIRASWRRGGPDVQIEQTGSPPGGAEAGGWKSHNDVPSPCTANTSENCSVAIANEYIAMRYGAYIRYVTLQLKNLMTFMSIGLLLFLLATVSYPFRAPRAIAWSLLALVVLLLCGVGTVLLQMDRDSILSRMSETPEKVNRGAFLWHMLSVGGLPVVTAISALFPSVGNFLFSWLQPLLSTFH